MAALRLVWIRESMKFREDYGTGDRRREDQRDSVQVHGKISDSRSAGNL
jgi:hypothetical protein